MSIQPKKFTNLLNLFSDGFFSDDFYKLNNLLGFKVRREKLEELLENNKEEYIQLGFEINSNTPTLKEINVKKLELGIRLARQMYDKQEYDLMAMSNLKEMLLDLSNLEARLKTETWLEQE